MSFIAVDHWHRRRTAFRRPAGAAGPPSAADPTHEPFEGQAERPRRKAARKLAERLDRRSIQLIMIVFLRSTGVDPNLHAHPQSARVAPFTLHCGSEIGQALTNDRGDRADVRRDHRIGARREADLHSLGQQSRQAMAHDRSHRGFAGQALLPGGQRRVRGDDAGKRLRESGHLRWMG